MIKIKRMVLPGNLKESQLDCESDWDLIAFLEEGVARYNIVDVDQALGQIVFEGEDGKFYRLYCVIHSEEVEREDVDEWLKDAEFEKEMSSGDLDS